MPLLFYHNCNFISWVFLKTHNKTECQNWKSSTISKIIRITLIYNNTLELLETFESLSFICLSQSRRYEIFYSMHILISLEALFSLQFLCIMGNIICAFSKFLNLSPLIWQREKIIDLKRNLKDKEYYERKYKKN